MRVKVYLHGHLREKVGKEYIETQAKSAYEALSMLANRYGKVLKAPLDVGRWKVIVKNYETKEKLMGTIRHNVLHIYPVFRTSKGNVLASIGNTLYAASKTFVGTLTARWAWDSKGYFKDLNRLIGGVSALFGMAPSVDTSDEQKTNSKYLGTIGNTTAVGTRIPFGYGLYKVSGHFITYNVSSTNVKVLSGENS